MSTKKFKILNDIHEVNRKARTKNNDKKYLRDQNLLKFFIETKMKFKYL
jgi:hypothetical protein